LAQQALRIVQESGQRRAEQGDGQTNALASQEAQVGDGEKAPAVGRDD
jgi:hypothetical protein